MQLIIIDNYDSFTYNLVHLVSEVVKTDVVLKKNDDLVLEDIDQFSHIILSPGPGIPSEAGMLKTIIERYYKTKKILGVCLGLQAIGEIFGAKLTNLHSVIHGQRTLTYKIDDTDPILQSLPSSFHTGRYHSWVIDRNTLIKELVVTCEDEFHQVMGIRHSEYNLFGVQFHPESIMTEYGKTMIQNFLEL